MTDSKILIGRKVKEIRKNNNITQETFSEVIGIETSSLSNIETGKSFPSMQTVLNIIEKFNVLPQDLFDYKYLDDMPLLEHEMVDIIKRQPKDRKQILYRIIKSFDI